MYTIGYYGSCSGCDWLEYKKDCIDGTISYKSALEYISDVKPKYIVPKNQPLEFTNLGEDKGFQLKLKKDIIKKLV